jgi:hypothetical protein
VKWGLASIMLAGMLAAPATAAAKQPLVPTFISQLVQRKAGGLAYAPTRAPFRYRYESFTWKSPVLTIRLVDPRYANAARHRVTFTARRFGGDCTAGKLKTLQLDGNRVYWDGKVAWRCVRGVKLSAAGPNLPDIALGQVVASVKRL